MGVVVFVAFKCANNRAPPENRRRGSGHMTEVKQWEDGRVVQTALYVKQ